MKKQILIFLFLIFEIGITYAQNIRIQEQPITTKILNNDLISIDRESNNNVKFTSGTVFTNNNFGIKKSLNNCFYGNCNPNVFINSTDPNTIEYDNIVSTFHATIIRDSNGIFKIWGENSSSNGNNLLYPTTIIPANGFNYIGAPLKATGGSYINTKHQFALLTTDGLYIWGPTNNLISSSIKNTVDFGKITVNGKADGLPLGVAPTDVKMMFGSYGTLAITTCSGEAWVLSFIGNKNGDGTSEDEINNTIWHRVKTSVTDELNNVVAMRGTPNALFALTSDGQLYTWGTNTFDNNSTANNRYYATNISKPIGVTPKMIGMTQISSSQTYYLLSTDGKLYAMGNNSRRQLGDGTVITSSKWKQVTATDGTNTLGGNIVWISPQEHDPNIPAINVLTTTNKLWSWGSNDGKMLGGTDAIMNPTYMPGSSTSVNGLKFTDEIIAVETGGHTTINIKKDLERFGYVGHKIAGSMADGTASPSNVDTYSYDTSIVLVCGAETTTVSDIQVNKTGPLSAQTGSTINYTISVSNNGLGNASNVIVKDPSVTNFTTTSITCAAGAGTLGIAQCPSSLTIAGLQGTGLTIPSLPDGSVVNFTVTGIVGNTPGTEISNVASAEYSNDANNSNNISAVKTNIYSCINEETTYTMDVDATLSTNAIAVNGGTINVVYKLTNGTALPNIGNQFILPVTYSDFNNRTGVDNQWEGLAKLISGSDNHLVISPKTSEGIGRLYNNLPSNNSTTESLMTSNNISDNIFTNKIAIGDLDPLGHFKISIGNYPLPPIGYVIKTNTINMMATGNITNNITNNTSGFWQKPLVVSNIRTGVDNAVNNMIGMPESTYVWRYSAFSDQINTIATNSFGTNNSRGVLLMSNNSITFAKICSLYCYKKGNNNGTVLDTNIGITAFDRNKVGNTDNWPMERKGGWLVLESKTKAFVPNRVPFDETGNPIGIIQTNFVEGMMVYDTTNKCLKIYTQKDGETSMAWHCMTKQTCPE